MTNNETDTLGRVVVKLPVAQFLALATRRARDSEEQTHSGDPRSLTIARDLLWLGAVAFLVAAGFMTILRLSDAYRAASILLSWLWVGMVVCLFCALSLKSSINQHRIKRGMESLREEVRDARPADTVELARISAQLEELPHVRAAIALERNVVVEQLGRLWLRLCQIELSTKEYECQRQADLIAVRENGAKLFESLHEHIDNAERRVIERMTTAVEDGMRKAYAAGYTDALATGTGGRSLHAVPPRQT